MTDLSKPQPGPQPHPQQAYPPPPQGGFAPPPPGVGGGYPPAPTAPVGGAPFGYYFHQESGLTLPNGTELASRGRRVGAFFLALPLYVVTLFIGYIVWGLILWGKGTSPALKVLKMKCYKVSDGTVATFGTMALRDIVGTIVQGILSVITLLVSFIMFLTSGQRRTLPDVIGGTVVLYDPNGVLG